MGKAWTVGGSGGVGAVVAILADLIQKEHASAILRVGDVIDETLHIPYARLVAILLVGVLAVAMCFIFECETMGRAFYTGASILTILMTAVPFKLPPPVNTNPAKVAAPSPPAGTGFLGPRVAFAQAGASAPVPLRLRLATSDGKTPAEVTVTLRDRESEAVVARSRLSGTSLNLYPASGSYRMAVEVPGYQIVRRDVVLRPGDDLDLAIPLEATWAPLSIQRIFKR